MTDLHTHLLKFGPDELNSRYSDLAPEVLVAAVAEAFEGSVAFANSFGLEDVALQHMILPWQNRVESFVLDTGRLPLATHELIETWRERYRLRLRVLSPQAASLEVYASLHGPNAFYRSTELRKKCCHIRKIEPLHRALSDKRAWFTGLRREQSVTRSALNVFALDEAGRLKISPLAHWSLTDTWNYVKNHQIPYSKLHDQGYPSIGCEPCTRAVNSGEDIRAGRWWWEEPVHKECGLHTRQQQGVNHAN